MQFMAVTAAEECVAVKDFFRRFTRIFALAWERAGSDRQSSSQPLCPRALLRAEVLLLRVLF